MGRVMALDVGEATVGVALGDPLGIAAHPLLTLRRRGLAADLRALADLIRQHEVDRVVVGLPLRLAGDAGPAARQAEAFAESLRCATDVVVEMWDERLTSVQAQRALLEADLSRRRRRDVIHQVAAALILQGYLDRRRQEET